MKSLEYEVKSLVFETSSCSCSKKPMSKNPALLLAPCPAIITEQVNTQLLQEKNPQVLRAVYKFGR